METHGSYDKTVSWTYFMTNVIMLKKHQKHKTIKLEIPHSIQI